MAGKGRPTSERWQPAVWSTKIKIEAQIFVN